MLISSINSGNLPPEEKIHVPAEKIFEFKFFKTKFQILGKNLKIRLRNFTTFFLENFVKSTFCFENVTGDSY